jgi:acetylornithine deacetylase/succinyl-diaminopimelate desuccinylase-like protein
MEVLSIESKSMQNFKEELIKEVEQLEPEAIDFLKDIVHSPSPSGREGSPEDSSTVVGKIYNYLTDLPNIEITTQKVKENSYNIIAEIKGTGDKTLLYCSHTDIVPPGDWQLWYEGNPFSAREGRVHYMGNRRVLVEIEDWRYELPIREITDRMWQRRKTKVKKIIYGRGTYDNKGSVAAAILALKALVQSLKKRNMLLGGNLIVTFQVDEEDKGSGIKSITGSGENKGWLTEKGYLEKPLSENDRERNIGCIILEGSYGYAPVIGHKGLAWYLIQVRGKAAHASTPHLGVNAIEKMAKIINVLNSERIELNKKLGKIMNDPLLGEPLVNAGTTIVGGGIEQVSATENGIKIRRSQINAIPDWCEATLDVRFVRPSSSLKDIKMLPQQIGEVIEEFIRKRLVMDGWDFDIQLDKESIFLPSATSNTKEEALRHPLIQSLNSSWQFLKEKMPPLEITFGATEAPFMIYEANIPTLVELGPAGALSHEYHEYVEKDQIGLGGKILSLLALGFFNKIKNNKNSNA